MTEAEASRPVKKKLKVSKPPVHELIKVNKKKEPSVTETEDESTDGGWKLIRKHWDGHVDCMQSM